MEAIELLFDAYTMHIEGDDLVVVIFSLNLGDVLVRIPLENIAGYFGAISIAIKEIERDNE